VGSVWGKSARCECQRWPVGSPAWLIQGLNSQPTQCTWRAWTRCPEGTIVRSPEGARCGLTSCLAAPMVASRGWGSPHVCRRWLPTWLPAIRPPWIRRRRSSSQVGPGLGCQLASLTARQDEITAGAGPLRAIAVRLQVALPALRALLAPGAFARTHQHTVTRDRGGVTMPRPLPAPART
jgi:hypothetical protein